MTREDACRILGVTEDADKTEITRKYEILLKRNKTARIEGVSDQNTVDIKEIDQAYNLLMGYDTQDMVEDYEIKENKVLKKVGLDEKKLRNFFYYYKFHLIIGIIVLIVAGSFITSLVTKPEPDFYLVFAGRLFYGNSDIIKDKITEKIPDIKHPVIDSALVGDNAANLPEYNANMKLTALLAAGDVDVFILDRPTFEKLGKQGFLMNLDSYMKKFEIDMNKNTKNLLRAKDEPARHLYGIDVTDKSFFKELRIIGEEKIVAISVRARRRENARRFVEYLLKNK